jgi:hypothetical protein
MYVPILRLWPPSLEAAFEMATWTSMPMMSGTINSLRILHCPKVSQRLRVRECAALLDVLSRR